MVFSDTEGLDVTLSELASIPDPEEADPEQLEAPWCTHADVDRTKYQGRIPSWRYLVDLNTDGADFTRPLGHVHQQIVLGDPDWTDYECIEHSPKVTMDYRQLDEVDDALDLELATARGVERANKLVKKKAIITVAVETADLDAANTSTVAALGLGAPAVNFSDPSSLPYVSCRVICERLAAQNGGIYPHWLVMDRLAAINAISQGGRTSLPTDAKLRELKIEDFRKNIEDHSQVAVTLDNTIEAGNRRFGNKIVAGYSSKAVQTARGVGFTKLNSLACVHAKFPRSGITSRFAIKRFEIGENIGIGVVSLTAYDVVATGPATGKKNRFVATAAY